MAEFNAERTADNHARSISALTEGLGSLDLRLTFLEKVYQQTLVLNARAEERAIAYEEATRLWREDVTAKYERIYSTVSRIGWIIGGTVLTSFVVWGMSGWRFPQ